LATGLQALKLSVARRSGETPFWQARYYDFNVLTEEKRIEKLNYVHWNPVKRGLVERMEEWRWSVIHGTAPEKKDGFGLNHPGQAFGCPTNSAFWP
jgi:putative transposase